MELLKRENFWVWILLSFMTGAAFYLLAAFLKVYSKDAWYAKWQNWLIGALLLFFPLLIMMLIFSVQIIVETAKKLNVPGDKFYASPLTWVVLLIVPVIGWLIIPFLFIYLQIGIYVQLYKGEGEQYII